MTKTNPPLSSIGTMRTFLKVGTCSETLCNVLDRAFDFPMRPEEHATMHLAGGIMQHGYQCGQIWGAALAAGAQAYRLHGPGPQAEASAIAASQKVVEIFRAQNNAINCHEITDLDKTSTTMQMIMFFLIRGGTVGCMRMAARFAPAAFHEIQAALSEKLIDAPSTGVSCASLLARKVGVSELHATMAAGLSGGIGLSGGACGALGAAVWILGMKSGEKGKIDFKSPRAAEVIERFLESSDYKFECCEIVGRQFENIKDHAAHLHCGGCSNIIEALADELSAGQSHLTVPMVDAFSGNMKEES